LIKQELLSLQWREFKYSKYSGTKNKLDRTEAIKYRIAVLWINWEVYTVPFFLTLAIGIYMIKTLDRVNKLFNTNI
jgi:hypothetical protein